MPNIIKSLGCKIYGHHHWVLSDVGFNSEQEDGSLIVQVKTLYGDCKRCGKVMDPFEPWRTTDLYNINASEVSMNYKDGVTTNSVGFEIRPLSPKDHND